MGQEQRCRAVFFIGLFVICSLMLSGCATLPLEQEVFISDYPEPERSGVYHKVKSGETLWRIAKAYDSSIDDIVRSNKIPNVAKIEENQLIFVPGAYIEREIIVEPDENENEFVWPIEGKVIHFFHQRVGNKITQGIDIKARQGATVKAARKGKVVFSDYLSGYGHTVILDHRDGYYSVYGQNASLLVKLGQKVSKHQSIAKVGGASNIAYLHFQIRKHSIEDNPLFYLP